MQRVTMKDISREMDVSINTVYKALNDKKGISQKTRDIVLKKADTMGYRVNRVAQSLARKPIHIGIITTEEWPEYYNELKKGVQRELGQLADYNVSGRFYTISAPYTKEKTMQAVTDCIEDKVDAIIICSYHQDADNKGFVEAVNKLAVPTVLLGSDLMGFERLCCVKVDTYVSGKLAAEFMSRIVQKERTVAVFIGNKDFVEHKEKLAGFLKEADSNGLEVEGVYETQDDPQIAYYLSEKILKGSESIGGVYIATGNSVAVCKCLKDNNIKNIQILGTDVFEEVRSYVEDGTISGIIFQDPIKQGRYAVKMLYRHLVGQLEVEKEVLIAPRVVLKSIIDYYL
ncbi:LacI family DNA-binding transcriptional regulator [Robinsoniella sp. KNHs210]|uniref:LacI family DNA-binding transcriptional regulator n=1 Tax=Robinsoniella sp. KNHs210 TaxID=1469950 RepID=UPI0004852B30|nr:LacI family DNA-binding transcriptional regulator [Robinsoniella sp. KNHs210]